MSSWSIGSIILKHKVSQFYDGIMTSKLRLGGYRQISDIEIISDNWISHASDDDLRNVTILVYTSDFHSLKYFLFYLWRKTVE